MVACWVWRVIRVKIKKENTLRCEFKIYVPCHLILQTYVIFQLELWIKGTFGHHICDNEAFWIRIEFLSDIQGLVTKPSWRHFAGVIFAPVRTLCHGTQVIARSDQFLMDPTTQNILRECAAEEERAIRSADWIRRSAHSQRIFWVVGSIRNWSDLATTWVPWHKVRTGAKMWPSDPSKVTS